jgi:membrane fusion protein (multidrug efflux system)
MAASRLRLGLNKVPEIVWRSLVFVIAALILIVITTRWVWWEGRPGWKSTDDAYLTADVTPIIARVPGYVQSMPVQDFQRVKAGQLIAQLQDDDYRATVARDEANVATAVAQAEVLVAQMALQDANVKAAEATEASTRAAFAQNRRDIARQEKLLTTGSSTVENRERLETTRAQLEAQLAQNRAQVEAAKRQLGVLSAQHDRAVADIAAQKATLELARINLGWTRIVAPQGGVVAQRQIKPGQYAPAGGQITSLTPLPHVWVVANFRETQLTHMRVGQRAEIRVDTFPGRVLRGHVQSFSPGSGAVFALLPPDNATGNFTKVVQRVPVKILIDDADGLGALLRPGLSVVARVDAVETRR